MEVRSVRSVTCQAFVSPSSLQAKGSGSATS